MLIDVSLCCGELNFMRKKEVTMSANNIPEPALDTFCFYLKDKIIEFYKNPENQAEFEKWLSKRELKS